MHRMAWPRLALPRKRKADGRFLTMSAFSGDNNKGSDEEQSLYDRFKKLTGRAPVVEATAPPKSMTIEKGEEDLTKQFQSIFGTKPLPIVILGILKIMVMIWLEP